MANEAGHGYLYGVLRRGAQLPATMPQGRPSLTHDPAKSLLPLVPLSQPHPSAFLSSRADTTHEVFGEMILSEDSDARASATPHHVFESSRRETHGETDEITESVAPRQQNDLANEAAAQPLDSIASLSRHRHPTTPTMPRGAAHGGEAIAASGGQALEVDAGALSPPAQLFSASAREHGSGLRPAALSDSAQGRSVARDDEEAPTSSHGAGRVAGGEAFIFDARRHRHAETRDDAGAHADPSRNYRRSATPLERLVAAGEAAGPDAMPTIIMPRLSPHVAPAADAAAPPLDASSGEAQRLTPPSTVAASPPQTVARPSTNDAARGDAQADAVVRRAPSETEQRQASEVESATPEWALRLARELSAGTTSASAPRAHAATPHALGPPTRALAASSLAHEASARGRAEPPKLTVRRLEVQIVNQTPAPAVQYLPAPHAESDPPTSGADLDRRYLGRSTLII